MTEVRKSELLEQKWCVGIIGAGVMGRGIAQAAATNGLAVVLVDRSDDILQQAIIQISAAARGRALTQGPGSESATKVVSRITLSTELSAVCRCNIVIENVTELVSAKKGVYEELGRILRQDTILAGNSSTIPVGELCSFTIHPAGCLIGMHFMNPAQTKTVVEVIAGRETTPRTIRSSLEFLADLGKTGILVKDAPGFVSNRVLMLTINESIRTVEAGTATAADVDRVFVGCFGHPMGPLATADLIGLDTVLLSLESLQTRLRDSKYEPASLLRKLVSSNQLGRKTGCGFFGYRSVQ